MGLRELPHSFYAFGLRRYAVSKEALIESWFDSLAAFLWFLSASGKKRNGAQDVRNARMMHNLL
jgi:hypothetical protein